MTFYHTCSYIMNIIQLKIVFTLKPNTEAFIIDPAVCDFILKRVILIDRFVDWPVYIFLFCKRCAEASGDWETFDDRDEYWAGFLFYFRLLGDHLLQIKHTEQMGGIYCIIIFIEFFHNTYKLGADVLVSEIVVSRFELSYYVRFLTVFTQPLRSGRKWHKVNF